MYAIRSYYVEELSRVCLGVATSYAASGAMIVALLSILATWNWRRGLQVLAVIALVSLVV